MIDRVTDEVTEKLPSRLTALDRLETTNGSFVRALNNNTLAQLTWVGRSHHNDLHYILERQGESLQSLEFRCEEVDCPSFAPDFDIWILPNMTQNLTHLSVNVPRNGTWPLESLQVIASLPHLKSADVWMNIQSPRVQQKEESAIAYTIGWERDKCKGENQFQRPFVDKAGAEQLFRYMKDNNEGGELSNVTFHVGDWQRPWDGPLYFPPWVEGRRAKVVCTSEAKGQDEGWCVVETGVKYWEDQHARYGGDYDEWDD
ncbi:hypothetical protein EK21DRAFT_59970 [Setomelanomma holmii]|uniref:Uncharacterized protein n=1 Tax=Setomelanomma holmii TaxID=210430 RepID=A0A9P4HGK2_9PLEO|nr:hypothetical protein EK21DRAFT_59970 [Setomelanomma holmii]